jgi:hypothetical protein
MLTRIGLVAAIVAAFTAGPALADKGGVPHNGGGQGGDHAAQPATPAQPGEPGDGATPATPAQPAERDDDQGEDEQGEDRPNGRGHDKSHGKSKEHGEHGRGHSKQVKSTHTETTSPSTHAKAGKTTICHSTGSASNPYVEITISDNALPAHRRHHDGRDIIPAPAGGCPKPAAATQGSEQPQAPSTTPDQPSAGMTPTSGTAPLAGESPSSATLGTSFTNPVTTTEKSSVAPRHGVLGVRTSGTAGTDAAGDTAGASDDGATADLPAETPASSSGPTGLPFTGLDLGILAAVGAAMVLAGLALGRARRTRAGS